MARSFALRKASSRWSCFSAAVGARAGHRGASVSIDDGRRAGAATTSTIDVRRCAAARAEEAIRIPADAGRRLRVRVDDHSGVRVRGADRGDFEILVCKAAASSAGPWPASRSPRAGRRLTVQRPRAATTGSGYLLDRGSAPGRARVSAAKTAPIGLLGLSGRVTARTENGPISLQDSRRRDRRRGGERPDPRLAAPAATSSCRPQNGPIGVSLSGSAWSGEAASRRRAVNGPVSLAIPAGYRSGTVVESAATRRSSAAGEACAGARRTWDDDHKRIELGDGTRARPRLDGERPGLGADAAADGGDDGRRTDPKARFSSPLRLLPGTCSSASRPR